MKKILVIAVLFFSIYSCKNKKPATNSASITVKKEDITTSIYPEAIAKIFKTHGGIDIWNTMKTLSFTLEKPFGKEVTTTHLKTRAEVIKTPNYSIGFNGKQLWINENEDTTYKGNAKFYKGLMFYFYAMPFIVGDSGIIYKTVKPLEFEGKTYPGILIAYEANVGESPDDEYIIYYNPETYKMEWLAYTVTFGKNEKSKDFHFIRYNNWDTINGLLLPKSIDWYNYENNLPTEKKNTVNFSAISISDKALEASFFKKPKSARWVE